MVYFCTFTAFSHLNNLQLYEILRARQQVFQIEQGIKYVDCDNKDLTAWHLCLWKEGTNELMAYLRVVPPRGQEGSHHSVGRVLTTSPFRGQGLGKAVMEELLSRYESIIGDVPLTMSAQAYLKNFYEAYDFIPESAVYHEEGIPHIRMTRHRS